MTTKANSGSVSEAGNIISLSGSPFNGSATEFDFRDFFENGVLPLHIVGPDGTILHANKAELALLGYSADSYIGRQVSDFYRDHTKAEEILHRLANGEKLEKHPVELIASDGSVRHVEIWSSGQFHEGRLVRTRCFTVDVTELTNARTELRRSDHHFRELLEALPVPVYTTDQAGTITYFNRAAAAFAGREPIVGKEKWCVTFRLLTADGQELPHDQCPMAIALRENRPVRNVDAIAQRPDGKLVPFLPFPTPLHDEQGELIGAVNVLIDLTERKKADEVGGRLSAIVESSFDAIISKDLNGRITTWNHGAERLFGYTAEEIIGAPITTLFPLGREDEEIGIIARIKSGERVESFETERRRKDGTIIPVSLTISPVRDATGRIVGASKIARDISAAKEAEQRIQMLMREVNHRVKNQYSVILSMIRETNKRSDNPDAFERTVRERIMALSRSHDLLVAGDWRGATMFELVLAQTKPFGHEDKLVLSGPSITMSPSAVQYLGMAFHELATNSAKYGVLSAGEGLIEVTWSFSGERGARELNLVWSETDGPQVGHIKKTGFGSVMLQRVAPQAVDGRGDLELAPNGITWTLVAPVKSVEAALAE
jgi:PAS domain S-box-containing protein